MACSNAVLASRQLMLPTYASPRRSQYSARPGSDRVARKPNSMARGKAPDSREFKEARAKRDASSAPAVAIAGTKAMARKSKENTYRICGAPRGRVTGRVSLDDAAFDVIGRAVALATAATPSQNS